MSTFILRKWEEADANDLAAAANNAQIAANLRNSFPHPYSRKDAEQYISICLANGEQQQLARAIVVDGKASGGITIDVQSDVYEKSAELGYWLAESCWGQGIMTQAVRQICREAFERFEIVRIFAEPFSYNMGSRRVLEKAGFTYEGTMRNGVFKNNTVYFYCMYSLLREEAQGESR